MSKSLAEMKAGVSERVRKKAEAWAAELRAEIEGLQPLRRDDAHHDDCDTMDASLRGHDGNG
jgi:hypothetical protein